MFQEIKTIILAGGTVKCGYKQKWEQWVSTIEISTATTADMRGIGGWLNGEPFIPLRDDMVNGKLDLDRAIREFGRAAFGKENLAVAFVGIIKYKLADDLDTLPEKELKSLVKKYLKEYYDQDYPFFAEFK